MSFFRLARRMRIRGANAFREADRVVKRYALALDQALVLGTPVATGRARSNWQVGVGGPIEDEIEPYSPLPEGFDPTKFSETANAQGAIDQGKGAIASRGFGQSIFITNNVPYIGELNDGSSAQAPAGFVEGAIQEAALAIRGLTIDTS